MTFKGLTYKDLPKIEFEQVNLNNFKYINYQYRQLGEYELVANNLIKVLKKIKTNYKVWILIFLIFLFISNSLSYVSYSDNIRALS